MPITSLPRSLTVSVVLILASVVSGRPWDGDTDIRSSNGESEYHLLESCLETSCAGLIGESLLSCSRHACRFASSDMPSDALGLLTCANTQCGGLHGWQYKSCVAARCLKSAGISSSRDCIDQCHQLLQPPKSVYECISSVCLSAQASSGETNFRLPSKRWVDRITCPTQCSSFVGPSLYRCCKGI